MNHIIKHETDTSPVPVFMLTMAQAAVKGVIHEHSDHCLAAAQMGQLEYTDSDVAVRPRRRGSISVPRSSVQLFM